MKHVWRNGTAPGCTAEVPEFEEKHIHHEYVLTAGVKSLPVHRHLMHVEKPMILRKPPHTVHKVLKGGGTTSQTNKTRDKISVHPYKHAAAIASSRTRGEADDTEDDAAQQAGRRLSSPSLFGVAGVIGGAEYDPYHKYRHNLYPFKEQLAHEVNKLVLEKQNLDKLKRAAAAAAAANSRHQQEAEDDESPTDSYDDDGSDDDALVEDDDDECLLSSPSTLVDEDDEITD